MAKFPPHILKSKTSRAHLSGPAVKALLSKASVGKNGEFTIKGKIRALSSSEYDDSIEMDMEDCEMCEEEDENDEKEGEGDEEGGSLSAANRRRKGR